MPGLDRKSIAMLPTYGAACLSAGAQSSSPAE